MLLGLISLVVVQLADFLTYAMAISRHPDGEANPLVADLGLLGVFALKVAGILVIAGIALWLARRPLDIWRRPGNRTIFMGLAYGVPTVLGLFGVYTNVAFGIMN